ncbi:MAG TPA: DapH/DapD/GlmU-related protein [Candidatus Thermoplasmatota archaeon]|nr:DapH/DapD/GlmU-related protein [Candidatus Thermoplasmatota archaeon]
MQLTVRSMATGPHPMASALRWPLLAAAHLVWIPSAALLVALFALAVAPAFALAAGALAQLPPGKPLLLQGLALGIAIPAGYGLFCILFASLVALTRRLLPMRGQAGRIPVTSPRMFAWYHGLLSTYAVNAVAGPLLRALGLYKWFAMAMGMKVGRGTLLNSTNLYDLDMIEVGKDVVIGGNAFITGHVVEHGFLVRRRIVIGDRAVIGLNAVVLPGATIGAGCHVGALSLVPKGAVLRPGLSYGGVPARPLHRRAREDPEVA